MTFAFGGLISEGEYLSKKNKPKGLFFEIGSSKNVFLLQDKLVGSGVVVIGLDRTILF